MNNTPAKVYVIYKGTKKTALPVKVYVIYKKGSAIKASVTFDTARKTSGPVPFTADTGRGISASVSMAADANRNIHASIGLKEDTGRLISAGVTFTADTDRTISGNKITILFGASTVRTVQRHDGGSYDTLRRTNGEYRAEADTGRKLTALDNLQADTVRQLTAEHYTVTLKIDTYLGANASVKGRYDTALNRTGNLQAVSDTLLAENVERSGRFDTSMEVRGSFTGHHDTAVTIPYTFDELNPQSISIDLDKGQLSDTFQMVTPVDMALESEITGRLLDFDYHFRAYESSGQGLLRTITGMYDVDRLLYTPFTYSMAKKNILTAHEHARNVARILGKSLYWAADDFTPSSAFSGYHGDTVQAIISGLFGWASNLPQDWINVFIRENTLKIVQRGHEPNEIDLTNTSHSLPSIDRHLMRSVWSGAGTHTARNNLTISPLGFYGTIRFGDSLVTYADGLVVTEVTATAQGETVTNYIYDFDEYLVKKVTTTPDGQTVETSYTYANTINDKYLATETAVTTDSEGREISTTVTQHVYLGNGWYGTAVYIDGVFQSSNVSNGKPGGKANKYIVDQSNLNLGGKYPKGTGEEIQGAALFDTEFPISDTATLKKLTHDIEWLNRKTEEKVTMDIWQYGHLIDFTDRIKFNGNTYYLESNHVSRTPDELKQTVTFIRWY